MNLDKLVLYTLKRKNSVITLSYIQFLKKSFFPLKFKFITFSFYFF